jgi:hypothetical protein
MVKYIDKTAVKAELEKCYNECLKRAKIIDSEYWNAKADAYLNALVILDNTLEVKEVDVEKESELIANSIMISVQANLYHTNVYDYEKRCYKHSDLKDAARKGIELSLKAKGE